MLLMEDSLPLMIYQFLDVMYNHIIYQGMYVAALIGLIVSAWGLFLPLNKSEKEIFMVLLVLQMEVLLQSYQFLGTIISKDLQQVFQLPRLVIYYLRY